jgi:hypothetical protein
MKLIIWDIKVKHGWVVCRMDGWSTGKAKPFTETYFIFPAILITVLTTGNRGALASGSSSISIMHK